MNLFFRILLAIYAFFLTFFSLIAIVITLKPELFGRVTDQLYYNILEGNGAVIITVTVEAIFFVLSLLFLFSGFRNDKDKKSVSKHTNIGEIKISLNSIENIALTTAKRSSGVRDTKAYVSKVGEGVSISIKTVVLPDINIPALSEDLQQKVKKSVEDSSGISVNDVAVIVENIAAPAALKARVE